MKARLLQGKARHEVRLRDAIGLLAGLFAGLFALSIAATAGAAECLSAEAKAAVRCDGRARKQVSKRKPWTYRAPVADNPTARRKVEPPPRKDIYAAPRQQRKLRSIERKLLIQEIGNVTKLYRATPATSPDRPRLLRRLGEDYVELESSHTRARIELEMFADSLRKLNPSRSRMLHAKAKKIAKRSKLARRRAIKLYTTLAEQHPGYCQYPTAKSLSRRSCTDEVLYFLAFEHEQAGNLVTARDVYLRLITEWPTSQYIANAYLAFGELYFDEAQSDPKQWPVAKRAYDKVLDHAPGKSTLRGYAHYKLGYVHWNQGRPAKAIEQFQKVISLGVQWPQLPNAKGLTQAARRDIVPVFSLAGDARKAWAFFQPLSGDNPGETEKTVAMMEALGKTLIDTGHYREASTLYRELLTHNAGSRSCEYQASLVKATMAIHSGKKQPVLAALEELLETYHRSQESRHDTRLQCANTTAALLSETAMAWHLEATGSGGVQGTDNPNTKAAAERLYRAVSDSFTAAQFDRFRFPHIVKEDWPTLARVRYAWGDLLYQQGNWRGCGEAFGLSYQADPNDRDAAEALFTAAECWQRVVVGRNRGSSYHTANASHSSPRPLDGDEREMMRAFDRYACNIAPPTRDADAMVRHVGILFARARTWFAAGHFDKAAVGFKDIASEHISSEAGPTAANLYLESLNVMATRWHQHHCIATMKTDAPKMERLYCRTDDDPPESCGPMKRTLRDLRRLEAEALVTQAGTGAPDAEVKLAKACDLYLDMWNTHGAQSCALTDVTKREALCVGYDEVLHNAAQACQAAHLLAKSISIRKLLIDPDFHLHDTDIARNAMYDLGANYQAIAAYDQAATWYERFARDNPTRTEAPTALTDAIVLRLGLGQADKALANARKFSEIYGRRAPRQASQIALSIGAYHADRRNWHAAERTLRNALKQIDRHASADVKVQTHALLGRAYRQMERHGKAALHYGKARATGDNIAALHEALDKLNEPPDRKQRRMTKALNAVGEALFDFAAQQRLKADAISFPEYRGSGTSKDVEHFVKTRVGAWLKRKKAAIEGATAAYESVVALNAPHPPPKWAIAAGAAVGSMWGELVTDFIDAPYPKEWDQPGYVPNAQPPLLWHELRAQYKAALAAAVEPHKLFAKSVYTECLEYGIVYQYFDGELRSCEQWLSSNYPKEFHLVDEFRGAPTHTNAGLAERPAPLTQDGRSHR